MNSVIRKNIQPICKETPSSATFEEICSWDNLLLAYRRASKGKRGLPSTAAFEYRLEENLLTLQEELLSRTYQPGAYTSFYIHEPKRRLISAAPFRDRVVHHALCSRIEPLFERSFIHDSYANRIAKGTHRALDRIQQFARRYTYVLQCDVRQFFPSIDHSILMDLLKKKIGDPDTLWLADRILQGGLGIRGGSFAADYFPGDDLFASLRPRGLPIGNLTSQFWANVYLNPLDHFIKRSLRCKAYLRYVDDMLLFSDGKDELWAWKGSVGSRLVSLRLTMHGEAHPRPVGEGIPCLGFTVFPNHRRLKRRKGIYYRRKLARLAAAYRAGEVSLDEISASVRGWVNHLRYGNTTGLREAVLSRQVLNRIIEK